MFSIKQKHKLVLMWEGVKEKEETKAIFHNPWKD